MVVGEIGTKANPTAWLWFRAMQNSGHFVLPATPKGSACTPLGLIVCIKMVNRPDYKYSMAR